MASQTPIDTPLLPSQIPSLPLGYNALNASIPIPTQVPSKITPLGHNPIAGFIPTLPQPPIRGSYPPLTDGSDPSGITQSFTPNYRIPVGRQFNPGVQFQPLIGGQIPMGTQPLVEGQPRPTPLYGQNIPTTLSKYWNIPTQGSTQLTGGNNLKSPLSYPLV
jgi:hypothetical protein